MTKKTNLQKLLEAMMMNNAGPNFYGNPSFGGTGNYGVGGHTQLAHFGLNPATEAMAEQEQEELEQNIEDQEWINNKYRRGFGFNSDADPVPHWNGRNGAVETVTEEVDSPKYDTAPMRRSQFERLHTPKPSKGKISEKALSWVRNWVRFANPELPSPDVAAELSEFRPKEPIEGFRWVRNNALREEPKKIIISYFDNIKSLLDVFDQGYSNFWIRRSIIPPEAIIVDLTLLSDYLGHDEVEAMKNDLVYGELVVEQSKLGSDWLNETYQIKRNGLKEDFSISRMRDLPGFPNPGTIVQPQTFTPQNASAAYENPIDGRKVEYLGPTLNGIPLDDATGNLSALALNLEEELIGKRIKNVKRKGKAKIDRELDKLIGPDPDLTKDSKNKTEAEDLILYQYIKDMVSEYLEEILGAPKATNPDRLGWNNTNMASLAKRINQIDPNKPPIETWRPQFGENPEQNPPIIYEPPQRSPLGGFGSIGWPKQFVPADYEVTHGQDIGFGEDLLGARRLRQSPTDDDRVGVNASMREARMKQLEALLEYLLNEGIDEGENAPTNPSLWSRAKAQARKKFKVYPSAYANAWAAKWYKGKGGGWRKKGKKKK